MISNLDLLSENRGRTGPEMDRTIATVCVVMACLVFLMSILVIAFVCGCCGGDAQGKQAATVPEPGPLDENVEMTSGGKMSKRDEDHKKKTSVKDEQQGSKIESKRNSKDENIKVEQETIPFQVRKMPKPQSHKVSLAPPGATTPPAIVPGDDDPTVNVAAKSQIKA